jgi:hypothetical protein
MTDQAVVEAASVAFTDTINPHIGGEERSDEISALASEGMPEALAAALPIERKRWEGEVRERTKAEFTRLAGEAVAEGDEHREQMIEVGALIVANVLNAVFAAEGESK